jgi:hypothetical protein
MRERSLGSAFASNGESIPNLDFEVQGAAVAEYAAVPMLLFKLGIQNRSGPPIQSIALTTQIRIAPAQRRYSPAEEAGLLEVFGPAQRWGDTLRTFLWTHVQLQVRGFGDATVVDMHVPCTYDFEVASAKYFHALEKGEVPLEFFFSGTMFYQGGAGLRVARISWEKEARYRMPVDLWQRMMDHYFPNSAWIRMRRDTFDRLARYRARNALPTWESALERLLPAETDEAGP